ncbi:sensor histidine kinase [Ramlibacter rhizophilus]|uniref:histidine kinase n=1 Tax=Ramlibacter rhizophilus TaxID=1781167 RepID=A0A4Z0BI26_9BURK|nr:ATP-binding protein [Ramlibacter rhizophilus]TFY98059.1 HAMP domain-containing protein [Ramlibacter rhizophilus]
MKLPLYLRLWLAVVAAVVVITLFFGWLFQASREERPMRELIVRDEADQVVGLSRGRPVWVPGEGLEFSVAMRDGRTLSVQIPPRPRPPGASPPDRWLRGSSGWFLLLVIAAVAVAVGSFPIARRLTKRLEALREGVERWGEGDLRARVDDSGGDEVAFLARRFNRAAERIEQLVASHKSLLANASHELRSPLARIRMGLELMGPQADAAARREIERNIAELDQLVEEILLASRLDAPDADIGPVETVDLTGLAAEECARLDAELLVSEDGHAVEVPGVARLLRRVVRNLLENARRYSEGPVSMAVRREGGQAVLSVHDRGPGVPPEQRERIFEPFYRLPGASERAGGVGLGLALVKSIVERHRGSVRCEGREGGGASFVVRLPAAA